MNTAKTNGESQMQVAIGNIIEVLTDKNTVVADAASTSLKKLAENHPNQVLNSCVKFCKKSNSNDHVALILKIMDSICSQHIISIDGDTILSVTDFCLETMIKNINYDVTQEPASNVLVAIGRKHHIQVLDKLIAKLEAGSMPHYMIPQTLGAVANANSIGIVPYLKDIFNFMIPLLGAIKNDTYRQAFSYAFSNFCESIVEYVANIDQVPDNSINVESFQVELSMIYEVLFTSWLYSKDTKVTESVLTTITFLFPLLTISKVCEYTVKLIQTILNLYKKNMDPYHTTKCLESVLKKATAVDGTLLEPLLNNIIQSLFELVCISPDYAQPELLKTHSEVLRCYECLAMYFTDHIIDQLVSQLKNNNDKEKIKGLLIITHLTSYSNSKLMERGLREIMKQFNELLNEPNIKIKIALMKIIVAFALKKVLFNKEINPDGPEKYMAFILKLCCIQISNKNDPNNQEVQDLQKSADNTLCMLSTSLPELETILWNLFMKSLLNPNYNDAVVVLLRCLTHLAAKKESTKDCGPAFVRCLVLLAVPLPNFRGTFILNFLKNIKPLEFEDCDKVWNTKIPQLMKYLEQNYDNFNENEWKDLVCDFLNLLLDAIGESKPFSESLLITIREQFSLYNNSGNSGDSLTKTTEKHFLLKCMAIILCHIKDKELVLQTIDYILDNIKLSDFLEIHSCAKAIGICSKTHLQLILDKLSIIRKELTNKKIKLFQFRFMKDKNQDLNSERLRYTIICAYAEVCDQAPADKLLKVVESEILNFTVKELTDCKDFGMRKNCLKTIQRVADCMHPNRNTLHIHMKSRNEILELVTSEMHLHDGPDYIEMFPIILPVMTSLIRLPPGVESEQRMKLLKLCFENVYNASAIYCKINEDNLDNYYGTLKLVPYITSSFTKLNQLVQELLLLNISPATLDEIVTLLELFLNKRKCEQRLPSLETLRIALQTYLDNMRCAYDCPSTFTQTGLLLARIVPRCTDPNPNIRKVAVECLALVLCIASRYEGHSREHDKELNKSMQHIQQQIEQDDPKLLYNLTTDMSHIICTNIPPYQMVHFIDGLIEALVDCESSSSNGSSIILHLTIKSKGGDLQSHISGIVNKILDQIKSIKCNRTRTSALRCIQSAASHHSKLIGGILLQQPLPFDQCICDCWSMVSTDPTLVENLLDQFKKIIKQTPLYEEHGNENIKIATLQPLQVICALQEILKNTQLKEIFLKQFSEMLTILLITFASYIGTSAPAIKEHNDKKNKYFIINRDAYKLQPAKVAQETFRLFLVCCDYSQMANSLITSKETVEDISTFLNIISLLVENICQENTKYISWLVASLGPFIRADFEPQRIAVVAFFTYLLRQKANDQTVLAENLLEMIMDVQMDQSCFVRQIGLQGLGYAVESLKKDLISRHCNSILGVLMTSLDYNNVGNEGSLILEGLLTFSKLLTTLEGHKFGACQVTAAVRIKPLFAQEDIELRKASFRLFGDLTHSLSNDSNIEAFTEQIQGNLITLLLHLCDPNADVVKACKYTLREVSQYISSSKVNLMINEHLIDEGNLNYGIFIKDLILLMAEDLQDFFPLLVMTSLSYFKSPWKEIRGNAALVAGLLYSNLNDENKSRVSLDTVSYRLINLLSDEQEQVRVKAVQALVYIFTDN